MSEEVQTRMVPRYVDVHVVDGDNYLGVDHDKFRSQGGMVYLAGVDEDENFAGETVHRSVMIPANNIKLIEEYSVEEEIDLEEEIAEMEELKAKTTNVDPEEDYEVETPDDQPHLPDLTVDEIEEALEDNDYHPAYLEFCVEEDDRVTAVELYEQALDN